MKNSKMVIKILICIVILIFLSGAIWHTIVRIQSQKYNFIKIDASNIPEPVTECTIDDYVQLTDVKMHYQVYGEGKDNIILIHGNGGSVDSLKEAAQYLANEYTVYLPESRCHGDSSDPGVISYDLMTKDIAEFIDKLNITDPIIFGHSDGGIIAIGLAADYPDVPKAIISGGANTRPDTLKSYAILSTKIENIIKPDKLNDMMLIEPNYTKEYMNKITCPAYIVCGEFDLIKLSDSVFIHESIKNSDFAVLKGENHGSYISHNGAKAYVLASKWLSEKFK